MNKRVTGIGGIFIKSNDPVAAREWYDRHLGFGADQYGHSFEWRHIDNPNLKGSTIWSTFPANTKYFEPGTKDFMLNFRVENLEWLLGELKKEGIELIGEMQAHEYGKFAHIMDPDGNKIELWEANDEPAEQTTGDSDTK